MFDDEDGDTELEDLNGGGTGWEDEVDQLESDNELEIEDDNNNVVQDIIRDNVPDEVSDAEDDWEGGEEVLVPVPGERRRARPTYSRRLVNSLDSSLNPDNYDALVLPT